MSSSSPLIRFEDARGRHFDGFRPVLAEEIEDGKAAVSAYIDEVGIDPEQCAFHFDIIDGAIVGDSDLAVRRLANASVDDPAIVDPDFEKGMFANIASRIEAGENIPHGRIEDVDGEACFIGNYD